jgi:hypothetical protein
VAENGWIGLPVEYDRGKGWECGEVVGIDSCPDDGDDEIIEVKMSDGHRQWFSLRYVRPLTASIAYQFRRTGGNGSAVTASPWEDLSPGLYGMNISVAASSNATKIEIRPKPKRSDTEVVEKLREYSKQNPSYFSAYVRGLIGGDF